MALLLAGITLCSLAGSVNGDKPTLDPSNQYIYIASSSSALSDLARETRITYTYMHHIYIYMACIGVGTRGARGAGAPPVLVSLHRNIIFSIEMMS